MNLGAVFFVLGNLLMVLGTSLLIPLAVGFAVDGDTLYETSELMAFGVTSSSAFAAGYLIRLVTRNRARDVGVREGFGIVTGSWLLLALVGMLPYLLSGVTLSVTDAFFETMSGFTTTGATTFVTLEFMPAGIHVWRSMTQWLGGMGVVVLSIALLPMLGVGGYRMMKAESPGGVAYERERPRITDAAKELWILYLAFTGILFVILKFLGMTWLDALCHAFTTLATGGFSTHTESVAYFSGPIQWTIIVFMLIGGINFSMYSYFIRGQIRSILSNVELRSYLIFLVAIISCGLLAVPMEEDFEKLARDVTFSVVSMGTSTGYATTDYDAWPPLMRLGIVLLMFMGGCMGSTAGGMKVTRVIVFAKFIGRELHRMIYPHAVRPLRVGKRVLKPEVAANIMAFGSVYALGLLLGTMLMTGYGYDLETSVSAAISALSNMGPALGEVGPTTNWAHVPDGGKWFMSILMLLGRLEMFSVLILFTPWAWRK